MSKKQKAIPKSVSLESDVYRKAIAAQKREGYKSFSAYVERLIRNDLEARAERARQQVRTPMSNTDKYPESPKEISLAEDSPKKTKPAA